MQRTHGYDVVHFWRRDGQMESGSLVRGPETSRRLRIPWNGGRQTNFLHSNTMQIHSFALRARNWSLINPRIVRLFTGKGKNISLHGGDDGMTVALSKVTFPSHFYPFANTIYPQIPSQSTKSPVHCTQNTSFWVAEAPKLSPVRANSLLCGWKISLFRSYARKKRITLGGTKCVSLHPFSQLYALWGNCGGPLGALEVHWARV